MYHYSANHCVWFELDGGIFACDTIDFNQCFIRGPTLAAHFSMPRFSVIFSGTCYRFQFCRVDS